MTRGAGERKVKEEVPKETHAKVLRQTHECPLVALKERALSQGKAVGSGTAEAE